MSDLLETLTTLECELHRLETRRSPIRMRELLHPDFEEFGRSGAVYTREAVLAEFTSAEDFPDIVASGFSACRLDDSTALLTYRSSHRDTRGQLHRHTLRSSIWLDTADGWRMRFHQGTAVDG